MEMEIRVTCGCEGLRVSLHVNHADAPAYFLTFGSTAGQEEEGGHSTRAFRIKGRGKKATTMDFAVAVAEAKAFWPLVPCPDSCTAHEKSLPGSHLSCNQARHFPLTWEG